MIFDLDYYRNTSPREFFTQRNRTISGRKVFISPLNDPELRAMGEDIRREIMASKFGLTWEQLSKIPSTTLNSMMLEAQGITAYSTAKDAVAAAKRDSFAATLKGYIGGFRIGGTVAAVSLVAAAVVFFVMGPGNRMIKK